ncbi:hypothetical protein [Nonomuraea zeae]|uniref:Uncharacterized protein n=1 Tax=Nonomuraea zeae TaxID=1642303 RepID=A0A5S4FFH0_9ACTN|nr:hypothetical protein [Nonomuraea zeae]TMR17506.1 hypothetical protein ETD85_54265 [Nonomuraea zeae]
MCVLIALHGHYAAGRSTSRAPGGGGSGGYLPRDIEDDRDVHYTALAESVDAAAFIADLKKRMAARHAGG